MTGTAQSGWAIEEGSGSRDEGQKSGAIVRDHLGVLAKGPLAVGIGGLVILLYLVVTGDAESPNLLAEYGSQGWELVAVVRELGMRATFYFKRRRQ